MYIFSEMIKIGFTGIFAKISPARAKSTLLIVKKMNEQGRILDEESSLNELMNLSRQKKQPVIESMLTKIDFAEKVWGDMEAKRPLSSEFNEFIQLLGLSAGAVSIDFVEGLESQK